MRQSWVAVRRWVAGTCPAGLPKGCSSDRDVCPGEGAGKDWRDKWDRYCTDPAVWEFRIKGAFMGKRPII